MRLVLFQSALVVGALVLLRTLPELLFVLVAVVPVVLYGLLANRTRRTPLRDARVLVTGASTGLGRALALEAARRGAGEVILVARTESRLQEAADALRALGTDCEPVVLPCDVTDPEAVQAMALRVLEERGPPDILVNNAGAGAWKHIEETSAAEAEAMLRLPALAAVFVTRAFVEGMAARGSGHVVNVTSAASVGGFRGAVVYATSRWAVRGFSQNLRADLAEQGIGVTLINGAEVADTEYFSDAPGKAGSLSHQRIPWLFQLGLVQWLSYDSARAAKAAWNGVRRGEHEVVVPLHLLGPFDLLVRAMPDLVHGLLRLGPNGRRG